MAKSSSKAAESFQKERYVGLWIWFLESDT